MRISILIPHFRNGKITAVAISKLLEFKGDHQLDIFVSDNSPFDGSRKYLEPFINDIVIFEYPQDKVQSHGAAYDLLLPFVRTEFFITMENDSFPTKEGWLDYYENLIKEGYDCATPLLKLSGGEYNHPCGGIYRKSVWEEAKKDCEESPYLYYPNMSMREGFPCHLMVPAFMKDSFLAHPEDYIELSDGYKPFSKELAEAKRQFYLPATMPFHNGRGTKNESKHTYGFRTNETEMLSVDNSGRQKLWDRIGAEPGQFMSWWLRFKGKKVFNIPTEVKWIPGKEGKQQEYTLTENGFYHIWGVSSYTGDNLSDDVVATIKQQLPDKLYSTLPEHQKIKE